jgi:hypothetical protein
LSSVPSSSSAEVSSSAPISPAAPARVMGFRDLLLFYVVTGISLRWIATAAGHGPSSLVVWLCAWLFLYIPLAVSVITLSSRFPAEGGFYVWTKKAFGEGAGFLCAWMYWTSNLPYFPGVLYFAASNVLFLHSSLQHFSGKPVYFVGFSVFFLSALTVLNLLGLNLAKWAHNLGAIAMWIPALIIIVLGFAAWARFGSATSFTPRSFIPTTRVQDMIFWSIIIFSFIGCESASVMGDEIKDARRNIPRALLFAGITVALCYMLGTFCLLLALPSSESSNLDGLAQAIAQTSSRFQQHRRCRSLPRCCRSPSFRCRPRWLSPSRFRSPPSPLENSLGFHPRSRSLRHSLRFPRSTRHLRHWRLQRPRRYRRCRHHGPVHVSLRLHDSLAKRSVLFRQCFPGLLFPFGSRKKLRHLKTIPCSRRPPRRYRSRLHRFR